MNNATWYALGAMQNDNATSNVSVGPEGVAILLMLLFATVISGLYLCYDLSDDKRKFIKVTATITILSIVFGTMMYYILK